MSCFNATPVPRVSDDGRARAFYTDVLGFEVNREAGDPDTGFGILRTGKAQVFATAWDRPEASCGRARGYFPPDDFTAMARHIKSTGTPVSGYLYTEYGMREIEVTDPDGNVICLGEDAA